MEISPYGRLSYRVDYEIERLRSAYDPKRWGSSLRVIFLGESPPQRAPNVFFYNRKGHLYKATLRAFKSVFYVDDSEFLEFFAKCGCFLYDFFGDTPGSKLCKGLDQVEREKLVKSARAKLRGLLEDVKPYAVIVVIKRVYKIVQEDLRDARERGVVARYYCLPFPFRKCYHQYVERLSGILHELRDHLCNPHV